MSPNTPLSGLTHLQAHPIPSLALSWDPGHLPSGYDLRHHSPQDYPGSQPPAFYRDQGLSPLLSRAARIWGPRQQQGTDLLVTLCRTAPCSKASGMSQPFLHSPRAAASGRWPPRVRRSAGSVAQWALGDCVRRWMGPARRCSSLPGAGLRGGTGCPRRCLLWGGCRSHVAE